MTTENTNTNTNLTVILDTIGRTVLGEKVDSVKGSVSLKNPVILHIVPADSQGKMSVQLLPLFFREFLGDKSGDVVFTYDSTRVTSTDIDALDFRLQAQYSQMFNPNNNYVSSPDQSSTQGNDSVVKLFDEETK
jgi:hypothetical protein